MLIDKFSGLRNDVSDERFEAGDLKVASNVLIDDDMAVERRAGATLLTAEPRHSLWTNGTRCFFVSGPRLVELNPDMSTTDLIDNLTDGARLSFAQIGERIFYANGYEQGVIDEGGARTWGIEVPALPKSTETSGSLEPGTYLYSVTHLMPDGQESGALTADSIEVTEGGIDFEFAPLGDATARVLYLSTANGEVLYEVQTVINSNATVTAFNDTVPMETMELNPPPATTHLVSEYFGHALCAAGEFLFYSNTYGPELFDYYDYYGFDSAITMIASTDNGIYLGTEQAIYFLAGRSPDELTSSQVAEYGVVPGSLSFVQARLLGFDGVGESLAALWLSREGICVGLPGGGFFNLTDPRYQLPDDVTQAASHVVNINGSVHYIASI